MLAASGDHRSLTVRIVFEGASKQRGFGRSRPADRAYFERARCRWVRTVDGSMKSRWRPVPALGFEPLDEHLRARALAQPGPTDPPVVSSALAIRAQRRVCRLPAA